MPRRLTKAEAEELFSRLAKSRPNPQTELNYLNPFTLLVSVVLSAQATDKGVNRATEALYKTVDTPQKMVALGEQRLGEYIKTIGLWRNKAKNVIALSQALIEDHDGEMPSDRTALEALPGVGRKTANVVLAEIFGQAAIAVDTHVLRVANRTGLSYGKTPRAVEDDLMKITPARFLRGAHHWLILHGRYVCIARKPLCPRCIVADLCRYPSKTRLTAPTKASAAPGAKRRKR